MADPFYGEIRAFGFNWPPIDWALCNGAMMQIQQDSALYAVLGATFGGDGRTTFALPDLANAVPMHWGTSASAGMTVQLGQQLGAPTVTLTQAGMPTHTHQLNLGNASYPGLAQSPANAAPSRPEAPIPNTNPQTYAAFQLWQNGQAPTAMMGASTLANAYTLVPTPHENRSPFQVVNFCSCIAGEFPPRPD